MIVSFNTDLFMSLSPVKPILTIYIIHCSPPLPQILDGMFCRSGVGKEASVVSPELPILNDAKGTILLLWLIS